MNRLSQWCDSLVQRQKEFHYFLLFVSVMILLTCLALTRRPDNAVMMTVAICSIFFLSVCFLYIRAWQQYCQYEYYGKRIRYEYYRVINKQTYKLNRLTVEESHVLNCLLKDFSPEEITQQMQIPYFGLYRTIRSIRSKLEVSKEEGLLDFDWSETLG
jgi:hypothetical protein